jgi:hypothetical protein
LRPLREDPEGTLSQALKRRIGAQHTIAELRQQFEKLDQKSAQRPTNFSAR